MQSRYWYTDQNRHRKEARVRIACPDGLSPTDEFYLWGLLSLTFSQAKPSADFYATTSTGTSGASQALKVGSGTCLRRLAEQVAHSAARSVIIESRPSASSNPQSC